MESINLDHEDDHSKEKHDEKLTCPYIGMIFKTLEEAENYYEEYGRQEGFWTRIRSTSKTRSRSSEVTSRLYVCSHEGKHVMQTQKEIDLEEKDERAQNDDAEACVTQTEKKRRRNCSTVKCGCKAHMRVLHDKLTGKWKVSVFSDIHNHKIVSPPRRMMMKSNRHMPNAAKNLTEAFQSENLRISKVPSMFGGAYNTGFDNRDCYNHLRNVRHKNLEYGDAQSVLNYFRRKQAENPQFFYAIQCDEDGRATNFFWVDSRSRMAYQYFGDVVTFDTTYRTNMYGMPFAPFIGVNHHFQSIQFGCALLQDETESTFLWLFETWLEAMGGQHPLCIITDQDLAMKGAIAKTFPTTRHRLCIWHIMKKFGEKLSHVYYKKSTFKTNMKKCIWGTYKVEDFEDQWKKLIEEHELCQNEWLQQLYDIRDSWVPVYNRGTFFAGMNTTGRSEGTNSFFDDFVTSTTNLREFVVKYEQALQNIVRRESSEDFTSEHKYRIVDDDDFLLKHAAQVYTRNIFDKFKTEWARVKRLKVEERGSEGQFHRYSVMKKVGNPQEFLVELNLQTHEGKCECQNMEFLGIICRHIMKVFVRQDIDAIPSHFILSRWKQGANKFRVTDSEALVKNDGKEQSEALRLSHMCRRATQLACSISHSNEAYTIYMVGLDELSKKISELKVSPKEATESQGYVFQDEGANNCINGSSESLLLDPNISKTKGRKKDEGSTRKTSSSKRIKGGIELAKSKQRKCTICQQPKHNRLTCPLNAYAKRKIDVSTNQNITRMQESIAVMNKEDSEETDLDETNSVEMDSDQMDLDEMDSDQMDSDQINSDENNED